jgi:hypothetical protein
MRRMRKAAWLALVVMAVAVPVVASMDRADLAVGENALVAESLSISMASTPIAHLVSPPSGSNLPESRNLFLVGSILFGLAAAVRKTA